MSQNGQPQFKNVSHQFGTLGIKGLNRLATCEATRIPNLLYQLSSFVLLVANRIFTKAL